MIRNNEPLARYTSWRVGGNAKQYYRPKNLDDLVEFVRSLPGDEEILFLGLGSNVLIRDGGFPGTVVHVLQSLAAMQILQDNVVKIEAGVTCAKIAKFCAKHALAGAEFFAGIPGTMGGALAMNAGAFGGETWDYVVKVDVINRNADIITRDIHDFAVGYRTVVNKQAKDEWFITGYLRFEPAIDNDPSGNVGGAQKVKALLSQRNNSQPIGELSCGSVFKNPVNHYAAKLIEASKLKGRRVGNAMVSNKHANFIINLGEATAQDIETLIAIIQETVWQDHGIALQLEVKIVGV